MAVAARVAQATRGEQGGVPRTMLVNAPGSNKQEIQLLLGGSLFREIYAYGHTELVNYIDETYTRNAESHDGYSREWHSIRSDCDFELACTELRLVPLSLAAPLVF